MTKNIRNADRGLHRIRPALFLILGTVAVSVWMGHRLDAVAAMQAQEDLPGIFVPLDAEANAPKTTNQDEVTNPCDEEIDFFAVVCCESGGMCTMYEGTKCPSGSSGVACPCQIP